MDHVQRRVFQCAVIRRNRRPEPPVARNHVSPSISTRSIRAVGPPPYRTSQKSVQLPLESSSVRTWAASCSGDRPELSSHGLNQNCRRSAALEALRWIPARSQELSGGRPFITASRRSSALPDSKCGDAAWVRRAHTAGSEAFSIHVARNTDYPNNSRSLLRFLDCHGPVIWTGPVNDLPGASVFDNEVNRRV